MIVREGRGTNNKRRRRRPRRCGDSLACVRSSSATLFILLATSSFSSTSALSSLSNRPNAWTLGVELPSRLTPRKPPPPQPKEGIHVPNLFEELKGLKPEPKPTPETKVTLPLVLPKLKLDEKPRKTRRINEPLSALSSAISLRVEEPSNEEEENDTTASFQLPIPQMTQEEQARFNDMTLGAIVSVGVLYVLATDMDPKLKFLDSVSSAATNIVGNVVPSTTYDILAVALGETFAGFTGAVASLGFNLLMMNTRTMLLANPSPRLQKAQSVINQALAESDYFLARAAVLPLLEGVGLSSSMATVASSLVATLPYELVKLGKQQRSARQQENEMLQELLLRQQLELEEATRRFQEEAKWKLEYWWTRVQKDTTNRNNPSRTVVDPSKLQPVNPEEYSIDSVELFADTCKWLAYSVLMKDFSGTLAWKGQTLNSGIESGFYGMLATLASQLYADFLYVTAEAGPQSKRDQVQAREASEWIQLYLSKSISAFTLFGVYTTVQVPVKVAINALLSGSIDSCIGSVDVDVCVETYYTQNPPDADFAAQVRAVITTIYSFSQIPSVDYPFQPSVEAQVRALVTTLVSLMHRLM
jgi:hypothetical protein